MNKHIITEISPLSEKDCLFIVERYKTEFTYPLHNHKEYELNFVENGAGVRRIVGDSVEEIGDYDLVLLCGDNLEHVWEQGNCQSKQIREITIQFSPDLFSNNFIDKKQFTSIRKMLDRAQKGLSFPLHAVMKVYSTIDSLLKGEPGFYQFVKFLTILYELSICDDARTLSSSSFARSKTASDSRRVQKVYQFTLYGRNQIVAISGAYRYDAGLFQPIFQIKNRKKSVGLYYRYTFGTCDKTVGRFDENGCRNML